MSTIIASIEGDIGTLKFNRPDSYNSFTREMSLETIAVLQKWATCDDVRCVVLRGRGRAFSAGQDLKEVIDPEGPEIQTILSEHYNPIVLHIRQMPKPVIAAVNGVAAGAGANIALACDIVVASDDASFIQAFSKIGLIPDSGGSYILPRLIGWQKAQALSILGDKVPAAEAERMGMIYQSVPPNQFEDRVQELAAKLAAMPTRGIALTKEAFNSSLHNNLESQLQLEEKLQIKAARTEDFQEGVGAFVEKRKPQFKGK